MTSLIVKACRRCQRVNPLAITRCISCKHSGFINVDFNPPWLEASIRERYERGKYEERVR